jgi:hypothetical protein
MKAVSRPRDCCSQGGADGSIGPARPLSWPSWISLRFAGEPYFEKMLEEYRPYSAAALWAALLAI